MNLETRLAIGEATRKPAAMAVPQPGTIAAIGASFLPYLPINFIAGFTIFIATFFIFPPIFKSIFPPGKRLIILCATLRIFFATFRIPFLTFLKSRLKKPESPS